MSTLPERLLDALRARGWTLATAESCTGGGLAAALTEIAGASAVVDRGWVTYSNASKMEMLGVSAQTLAENGAVSEPVAAEMADGARSLSGATIALSITGIAGPGGSEFKPEGRVCFGMATPGGTTTETVDFGPLGRSNVRAAAIDHALRLLLAAAEGRAITTDRR